MKSVIKGTTAALTAALLGLPGGPARADEDRVEQQLLGQVYAQGGQTLYCQEAFSPGDRLKLDFIYRERQLMDHFSCITSRQCLSKPAFQEAFHDLHNVYPVQRKVELDRRRTIFGDLPENVEQASEECAYKLSFQTFMPPDHAKGNVARAMLYMHKTHDLPLVGSLEMYQRWNRLDPPDETEQARNEAIAEITGQRNLYIDNPEKADELTGMERRRSLQFQR